MRVVTLNLDLQDVPALRGAVDCYLATCDCRKDGRESLCDTCAALEFIQEELTRLQTRPRLRIPAPVASADSPSPGPTLAASARSQLRIVPPVAAEMQ